MTAIDRLEELAGWFEQGDPGSEGSVFLAASVAKEHAADLRTALDRIKTLEAELSSAAGVLEHIDGALMDMADAGATPAFGSWKFVTKAAKRARALTPPPERQDD